MLVKSETHRHSGQSDVLRSNEHKRGNEFGAKDESSR